MKKIFALLLAMIMVLSFAACGSSKDKGSTLVYGSGDYDSINPIMNEHCEIKHLLFDSLVKLDEAGSHASYHKVMDAVACFEKGNEMLAEVLKGQE